MIHVTKRITISQDATFADLYSITFADWYSMPTIEQGHWDNLKFISPTFRVWLSRASLADYNGDVNMYSAERLRIEQYVGGEWRQLNRYGKVEPR